MKLKRMKIGKCCRDDERIGNEVLSETGCLHQLSFPFDSVTRWLKYFIYHVANLDKSIMQTDLKMFRC